MISRGGAGGYSLVAFHNQLKVRIKNDIHKGGDHILGGRMCGAGNVRSLLSSDGADGLGGTTVWIHWSGIDQKACFVH